jgi:hypothetical protein
MTKIGVGVGEEFPLDEPAQTTNNPEDQEHRDGYRGHGERFESGCCYSRTEYEARRAAYRQWRDEHRALRRQWRDEWRARKRAFRDELRRSFYETFRSGGSPPPSEPAK